MTDKYVVLGESTHFTYNSKNNYIFCTHGAWGGTLKIKEDGSCSVAKIKYDSYVFTDAEDYCAARELGLIK